MSRSLFVKSDCWAYCTISPRYTHKTNLVQETHQEMR